MTIVICLIALFQCCGLIGEFSYDIMEWVQIRDDCIRLEVSQQENISSRK